MVDCCDAGFVGRLRIRIEHALQAVFDTFRVERLTVCEGYAFFQLELPGYVIQQFPGFCQPGLNVAVGVAGNQGIVNVEQNGSSGVGCVTGGVHRQGVGAQCNHQGVFGRFIGCARLGRGIGLLRFGALRRGLLGRCRGGSVRLSCLRASGQHHKKSQDHTKGLFHEDSSVIYLHCAA